MTNKTRGEVYPVTTKFEGESAALPLISPENKWLLRAGAEFIGEYEHGSADIDTLLPKLMEERGEIRTVVLTEKELLQFAANVVLDFVSAADIMKEEYDKGETTKES